MAKTFRIQFTDAEAAELLAYKPLAHWQQYGRDIAADALRSARMAKKEADVVAANIPEPAPVDTSATVVTIV